MNMNVDVGSNITSILERLAEQIGVTADKVFPWYVQQAYIEGWTTLVAVALFLLMVLVTFSVSLRITLRRGGDTPVANVALVSGIVLIVTLFVGSVESIGAVRKIANPNYYAMSMLMRDIGHLTAR